MYFCASADYADPPCLIRPPDVVREELKKLDQTVQEGEQTLARLAVTKEELRALRAKLPCFSEENCRLMNELLTRIESAEEEYRTAVREYESRAEELAESLARLGIPHEGRLSL